MNVFFYGLFMDASLLASKGITPRSAVTGHVDDFELRIGDRATLAHCPGSRVFGVMMDVADDDVNRLYAEDSVADYLPETVTVEVADGSLVEATCYNLPADRVEGTNKEYARALCGLAERLGLDDSYAAEIRRLAE